MKQSFAKMHKLNKKLYESGLIDRSEFLSSMLFLKNKLNEAEAAPASTAPAPRLVPAETYMAAESSANNEILNQLKTRHGLTPEVLNQAWNELLKIETNKSKILGPGVPNSKPIKKSDIATLLDHIKTIIKILKTDKDKYPHLIQRVNSFNGFMSVLGITEEDVRSFDSKYLVDNIAAALENSAEDPERFNLVKPFYDYHFPASLDFIPFEELAKQQVAIQEKKSFILAKKLYKAGLIESSEYLAALVRYKNLITEATASAGDPTAEARKDFGSHIADIGSDKEPPTAFMNYNKSINSIQDLMSKVGKQQINESKKRLIKNLIKKRILDESLNGENQKEYLNEILGILFGAALLALGAWIGKKFSKYFASGPAKYYEPSNEGRSSYAQPNPNRTALLGSGVYNDGRGNIIDDQGRKVDSNAMLKVLAEHEAIINETIQKYPQIINNLNTKLDKCNYTEENKQQIKSAIAGLPPDLTEGRKIIPALKAYIDLL